MRYYYPFGTDTDLPGQFKVWRMITQKGSLLPASKNKETKKKIDRSHNKLERGC